MIIIGFQNKITTKLKLPQLSKTFAWEYILIWLREEIINGI